MFGGINEDQIVGGVGGLKKMQTLAYRPEWTESVKQWTLEGQSLMYGEEPFDKIEDQKKFAAIIDTGTSNIGVPSKMFEFLKDRWYKSIDDLDCMADDNFCQTKKSCDEAAKKLKPISVQMSGQVFEMPPNLYLHQTDGRCQLAIHNNEMRGSSSNLMVVGDLLLRHLYQVYDFDNETISLGVNKHSEN